MLMMMGCRLLRWGGRGWARARIRSKNAGLSDKAEDCRQKQNAFCHNIIWFAVEIDLLITFFR